MELNKQACLREGLANMDSGQLNGLLQLELGKEPKQIDSNLVRRILTVLENREATQAFTDDGAVQAAADKYRIGCKLPKERKKPKKWLLRIATAAAIVVSLVLAVPRVSGEGLFVEFITRIAEDVIAFFSPEQSDNRMEYEFHTDHPGLQQVYDTMSELGVTAPVVPSWIPKKYELVEITEKSYPSKYRIAAKFEAEEKSIVLCYDLYGISATHEYHRDDTPVEEYERAGIIHEIYLNYEKFMVYWRQENIDCFIVVDCVEDSLIRMLDSIYMMEEP